MFEEFDDLDFTLDTMLEVHRDMRRTIEDNISMSRINSLISPLPLSSPFPTPSLYIIKLNHLAQTVHILSKVFKYSCPVPQNGVCRKESTFEGEVEAERVGCVTGCVEDFDICVV